MVNTDKLRGVIAERGKTMKEVAEAIGIAPRTFYIHMSTGRFWTDEVDSIIKYLGIPDPENIFLATK